MSTPERQLPLFPRRTSRGVRARSIMNPSRVPTMDWTINPYVGCAFGCTYCYAQRIGRQVARRPGAWGSFAYPKENLERILARELQRPSRRHGRVFLSSVTDPYQPLERRLELTRTTLRLLGRSCFQGQVSVLTRSPLVTRDIDLLQQIDCEVGLTITAPDDPLTERVEAKAPRPRRRLETLRILRDAGLSTWAFVGPLLPHLVVSPGSLEALFAGLAETGTKDILLAHLNAPSPVRERIAALCPDARHRSFYLCPRSEAEENKRRLQELVWTGLRAHGLRPRFDSFVDH